MDCLGHILDRGNLEPGDMSAESNGWLESKMDGLSGLARFVSLLAAGQLWLA